MCVLLADFFLNFESEKCFDFEYYKRVTGFIMAYSFRDPNEDVILQFF